MPIVVEVLRVIAPVTKTIINICMYVYVMYTDGTMYDMHDIWYTEGAHMMRVQRVHTRIESSTGGKGVWRVGVAKNETKRGFFVAFLRC